MVKLEDPTLPFAEVVARRRREQAATDAATFGLWASTHDWRTVYPEPTAVAGIGASEQALRDPEVDLTQQLIGASGGLLVDLGFQVCPIHESRGGSSRALATLDRRRGRPRDERSPRSGGVKLVTPFRLCAPRRSKKI